MQAFIQSCELIVAYFQSSLVAYLLLVFVFSLCVGSFLNVVIYRLPKMMERSWQQEYQQPCPKHPKFSCRPPSKRRKKAWRKAVSPSAR